MIEICVQLNGVLYPTVAPAGREIEEALAEAGVDPKSINRVRWPVGATRWGSCWLLFAPSTMESFRSAGGFFNVKEDAENQNRKMIVFGDVVFDRMFARIPIPIVVSEGSGVLWAVEFVDERFMWQNHMIATDSTTWNIDDVNLTAVDKDNMLGSFAPRTGMDLLESIRDQLHTHEFTTDSQWNLDDSADRLSRDDTIRDMAGHPSPAGLSIDSVCMACGYVLVARPKVGDDGYRYKTIAISDGANMAAEFLRDNADHLIGGGIYASRAETTLEGLALLASGDDADMAAEETAAARVAFPTGPINGVMVQTTLSGGVYTMNAASRRNYIASGFSPDFSGRMMRTQPLLYDSLWAHHSNFGSAPDNSTDLDTRATHVIASYYGRFSAGVGNMAFRGLRFPDWPWSGAHEIDLVVDAKGPRTRIRGSLHDPIFGFNYDVPVTARNVNALGGVRAIPRPWPGLSIGTLREMTLYLGAITAVNGSDPNFTYDVKAVADESIAATGLTPLRNDFLAISGMTRTITAASVASACILGLSTTGTVTLLMVDENYSFA